MPAVTEQSFNSMPRDHKTASVSEIVATEELILTLTRPLGQLGGSIKNLRLPDHRVTDLFADDVGVNQVDWSDSSDAVGPSVRIRMASGREGNPRNVKRSHLSLLSDLFDNVDFFESVDLKLVDGQFVESDQQKFRTTVALEGRARRGRTCIGLEGELLLQWHRTAEGPWRIARWTTQWLKMVETARPFFEEVASRLIDDPKSLAVARACLHESKIESLLRTGKLRLPKQEYYPYFTTDSAYQHPGAAVVDIDRDGDDDLYVTARWGRNQLWTNQGNGRFIDQANMYGLDIDGLCNCAIFADFDNDGDADAFIGRSLEPSMMLENVDGNFRAFGDKAVTALPHFVSTASACDFNGDGLLDLFLGTYGPRVTVGAAKNWPEEFLLPQEAEQLRRRSRDAHRYFDLVGPPNVLLINEGQGKFARTGKLNDYRNTYQGVWSDFDLDGDPDLYVCNDFAPDALYRNDQDAGGDVRFKDVSASLAGDAMRGFGMGATWGDYDRDGRPDLYVSNMYSKAGRRIIRQVGDVDQRITYSAQGNLLFRNHDESFEQLAGLKSPSLPVAKVGWSFGGQFADVDNDGWLDVYVPSGFYSAPRTVATDVDL